MGIFRLRLFAQNEGCFWIWLCFSPFELMDRPHFWIQAEWDTGHYLRQLVLSSHLSGECQFWSSYVKGGKSCFGSSNFRVWADPSSTIWGETFSKESKNFEFGSDGRNWGQKGPQCKINGSSWVELKTKWINVKTALSIQQKIERERRNVDEKP